MSDSERPIREIARNRKAKHDYEILETVEVGVALVGTEVKTLRAGEVSLGEAFVRIRQGQMWLEQARIDEYREGNRHNHDPARPRRLLARRREIDRWAQRMKEKGLTIIPLRLYFRGRVVKLEIGLGRGRKRHDKRQVLKERDSRRELRKFVR
jgi:SsrA-binding protein